MIGIKATDAYSILAFPVNLYASARAIQSTKSEIKIIIRLFLP